MNASDHQPVGPGALSATDAGHYTVATTTMLSARRAMAYAASINDTSAACYDDLRAEGLAVHPGICFSLQWNTRFMPDLPPNPRAAPFGVHAATDLRVDRPFRVGEAVTTQGRMIERRQIAPGVLTCDRYTMRSGRGERIAELDYISITRGATLNGDAVVIEPAVPPPAPCDLPDAPRWSVPVTIAAHAGQQYTECADIYNPIHTEPSVALAAGLPGIILHGSATKAIALSHIVEREFGGDLGCIRRLTGQLRGMVLIPSRMFVECLAVLDEPGLRTVHYRVLNEQGQPAIASGCVCGVV